MLRFDKVIVGLADSYDDYLITFSSFLGQVNGCQRPRFPRPSKDAVSRDAVSSTCRVINIDFSLSKHYIIV